MPAQFGFQVARLPFYINTKLRSDGDYGVTAYVANTPQIKRVTAARATIWGTPADPSHDFLRGNCARRRRLLPGQPARGQALHAPAELLRQFALPTTMSFDTWRNPGTFLSATATEAPPTACNQPDFSPTIEAKPTTDVADSATGLHVDLHLPQKDNEDPEGLGHADLKDATVTLPPGFVVNPSSADGARRLLAGRDRLPGHREKAATASLPQPAQLPRRLQGRHRGGRHAAGRPSAARLGLPRPPEREPLRLPPRDLHRDRRPPDRGRRQARRARSAPTRLPASSAPPSPRTPSSPSKTSASISSKGPGRPAHAADLRRIGHRAELHDDDLAGPLDRARRRHRHVPLTPSRSPSPRRRPLRHHRGPVAQRPQLRSRNRQPPRRRLQPLPPAPETRRRLPGTERPERHLAPGPDREAGRDPGVLGGRSRPCPEPHQPRSGRPRAGLAFLSRSSVSSAPLPSALAQAHRPSTPRARPT